MKIETEVEIDADIGSVWDAWNNPADIMQWNAASDDWHTTACELELQVGGSFCSRMEAKDGSMGFDFAGTYTRIDPQQLIEYELLDGRVVSVSFISDQGKSRVQQVFDADDEMDVEQQRAGWQSILNNFARHVQSKTDKR